jgi:hypothetical protein
MSIIFISQTQHTTQALHGTFLSHLIFSLNDRCELVELRKGRMKYTDRRHSAHDISLRLRRSITMPRAAESFVGGVWALGWLREGIASCLAKIRPTSTRRCIGDQRKVLVHADPLLNKYCYVHRRSHVNVRSYGGPGDEFWQDPQLLGSRPAQKCSPKRLGSPDSVDPSSPVCTDIMAILVSGFDTGIGYRKNY